MEKEYLEALECLEWINRELKFYYEHLYIILRDSKEALISNMKKANEYLDTIKQVLIQAEQDRKELEEYKKLNLPLLKQILENGVWVKGEHNNFYHLSPTDMNIVIKEDYFIIQELYFEDLDCVMDTTGFELCSSDYKENFWLKEDRSE